MIFICKICTPHFADADTRLPARPVTVRLGWASSDGVTLSFTSRVSGASATHRRHLDRDWQVRVCRATEAPGARAGPWWSK